MSDILGKLGIGAENEGAGSGLEKRTPCSGDVLTSFSPIDGKPLASIRQATETEYDKIATTAQEAFQHWRTVPAPQRGEIVRQLGLAFRERKAELGELVSREMGKIRAEGEGEVQEMIDMCDFAVGQSRMLYGLTMHSERPGHRMYEQWRPLGPVGIITAFNFPVAVWAWNAMLALIAGDTVIWKPSSKVPLCALAAMNIAGEVLRKNGLPEGILNVVVGGRREVGDPMVNDRRIALISATGSVAMGRKVGQAVAARLGRSLLELGGNNGVIVTPSANRDLAVRAILFGAVGTAGQRCTTIRRAIIHEDIYETMKNKLMRAYAQVIIGDPLDSRTLMGPLIDREAVENMRNALDNLKQQGGEIYQGGEVLSGGAYESGAYVTPCVCGATPDYPIVREETFAPILYLMAYRTLDEAIAFHNAVPQGLSSSIFTNDLREAERFLSATGSDCGIANVNISTSGAEIGGAFGGEKDTGGGRESGSDAWKAYMARQTCTINWSESMTLAQGIEFGAD